MVSRDLNYIVTQLERRIERMEGQLASMVRKDTHAEQDWDNPTLLKNWKISERTAAYYRKAGLEFYKRGGRLHYTPESREKFVRQRNSKFYGDKQ